MTADRARQRCGWLRAQWLGAAVLFGLMGCTAVNAEVPTPAEYSTGPLLQWSEVGFGELGLELDGELGSESAALLDSTSDGRVVVGIGERDGLIVVTEDWSHVPPRPQAPPPPATEGVILVVTTEDPHKLNSADGSTWRTEPIVEHGQDTHREASTIDPAGRV